MAALTSMETSFAARRLGARVPHVAAVARIANPDDLSRLCREELSGVDVHVDGWDIRARWFGVLVLATPNQGELDRPVTLEWRVVAQALSLAR